MGSKLKKKKKSHYSPNIFNEYRNHKLPIIVVSVQLEMLYPPHKQNYVKTVKEMLCARPQHCPLVRIN